MQPVIVTVEPTLLQERYDMIVPVSLYASSEELRAEVYPQTEAIVCQWFKVHSDAPMTEDALQSLHNMLNPLIATFGYMQSDYDATHHLRCYKALRATVECKDALPYSRIFDLHDRTSFEPEEDTVCYGMVRDGAIVSLCGENGFLREDCQTEIAVETAPGYEGQGYATRLVATVCRKLQKKRILPLYKTDVTNLASQRVAEKAGLTWYGEEYHFCFEKA